MTFFLIFFAVIGSVLALDWALAGRQKKRIAGGSTGTPGSRIDQNLNVNYDIVEAQARSIRNQSSGSGWM